MLTLKHEEGKELEICIVEHESSLFDGNVTETSHKNTGAIHKVAEAMRDEYALFKGMVELAEELH